MENGLRDAAMTDLLTEDRACRFGFSTIGSFKFDSLVMMISWFVVRQRGAVELAESGPLRLLLGK